MLTIGYDTLRFVLFHIVDDRLTIDYDSLRFATIATIRYDSLRSATIGYDRLRFDVIVALSIHYDFE